MHTYGIGLAVTFWFAYSYFCRRLRKRGYPSDWVAGVFIGVIIAAVVGARAMHVLANLSYYEASPGQIIQVWHGGLSSFGGLLGGIPVGFVMARRRFKDLTLVQLADMVAPVLIAAWGVGRLLGPQLMIAGGGHPTTRWFGMYYADQAGKRLPVPIFQAVLSFAIFLVVIRLERYLVQRRPAAVDADSGEEVVAELALDRAVAEDSLKGAPEVAADGAVGGAATEVVDSVEEDEAVREESEPSAQRGAGISSRSAMPVALVAPAGLIVSATVGLWGIERATEEHLWLAYPGHLGSVLVQVAGLVLFAAGAGWFAWLWLRGRGDPGGAPLGLRADGDSPGLGDEGEVCRDGANEVEPGEEEAGEEDSVTQGA